MYHQTIVVGNLGADPSMKFTPSGQAVCSFSVASTRKYNTSNGEQVNETIWFRISAWGKQAEACNQFLKKGSKVLVEGRLTPDKTTGGPKIYQKQDGTSAASFEITAQDVKFLSSVEKEQPATVAEDDIPF